MPQPRPSQGAALPPDCRLCGSPAPDSALREGGFDFCCRGCREVHRLIGDRVAAGSVVRDGSRPPVSNPREAFLWIDGMHCASCEVLIERAARDAPGVLAATASFATSTAHVVYDADALAATDLPEIFERVGYAARMRGEPAPEYDDRQDLLRVLAGGCLASAVMMMTLIFIYPVHAGLSARADFEAISWVAFTAVPVILAALTTVLVFYVGWPILRGAWTGVRVGVLNMDSLVALSILAAFGYSLVQMLRDPIDLYFEVAGTLVAIVTIGRYLERGVRARATRELGAIMRAWTPSACVRRNGEYLICPVSELVPGERVYVRAGETVPVDGTVVEGEAAIDESLLTGEPYPVRRVRGARVMGGSALVEGELQLEAGSPVECRMESLARALWSAQSKRAGVHGLVDRLARVFVPFVVVLSAVVGLSFHVGGATFEKALLASLATLIVSCPCTFALAIPLTTASALGEALRRGIIMTRPDLFERTAKIDIVAIDKTGTLSTGEMEVVDVIASEVAVARAAAVERMSSHPVARAIGRLDAAHTATQPEIHPGRGALGRVIGTRVAVGSRALFAELGWVIPEALARRASAVHPQGECVVSFVGWGGAAHGAIVTADRGRPQWERVVERLRRHARVVLLTGAEQPGAYALQVDEVHAGVPPEEKALIIRKLKAGGTVAMIGDGSNDAAAIAEADLGIAVCEPTELATQAADVVVPGEHLERVPCAFALIAQAQRRIRQNLGWALTYNVVAIPLAVSGTLNPLFAALAMSASSIVVVLNAARRFDCDEFAGSGPAAATRGEYSPAG